MAAVTKNKVTNAKSSAPASSSASRKPRAHPPYVEMIKEAIVGLKERTGSSQIAIAKFIEGKQKPNLPTNFKKLLLVQLKKLVANGKLVKVKNSFKLPPKSSSHQAAAPVEKPAATKPNAAVRKPEIIVASVKKRKAAPAEPKAKNTAKSAAGKSRGKKAGAEAAINKKVKAPVKALKKPKSIKSPVKKKSNVKKAK